MKKNQQQLKLKLKQNHTHKLINSLKPIQSIVWATDYISIFNFTRCHTFPRGLWKLTFQQHLKTSLIPKHDSCPNLHLIPDVRKIIFNCTYLHFSRTHLCLLFTVFIHFSSSTGSFVIKTALMVGGENILH